VTVGRITEQLNRMAEGDDPTKQDATAKLLEYTYQALHRIAENKLRREGSKTRATRLVNDMIPGLLQRRNRFNNRQHFFAWAKRQIDRVYISQKRSERAETHGGAYAHVSLTPEVPAAAALDENLRIDIGRAIRRLPPQDRDFLTFLAEGYTIKVAAEMASIPVEVAPRRRQLIIAKLANLLGHGTHA
jgi:RNA polymerase sigma factor (sigma-70 family)